MRILQKSMFVVSALVMLTLCSCTSMVTISPSTTPITANDTYTELGYTIGRSYGFVILWFLPFFEQNPSKAARDAAIEKSGGNAMIEVTEENNVIMLFVFSICWSTVEGTAVKVEREGRIVE